MKFNINEAKTNLSKLVQKVLDGEEVIIASAQKPLVKLVKIDEQKQNRERGIHKSKIQIAGDFDEIHIDFREYM